MGKRRKKRTTKITGHANGRLKTQVGFKGCEGDLRKLLKACSRVLKRNGESCVMIRSSNLPGVSLGDLKKWGLVEGKWFAVGESDGTVMTIKEITNDKIDW